MEHNTTSSDQTNIFDNLFFRQKNGSAVGIPSICSSHPYVIRATMQMALKYDMPVLIESTCNQVNQYGGYAGMTPWDFFQFTHELARQVGYPIEKLFLGGDHLGPYPWHNEPVQGAMDKATELVHEYVLAGFTKIHLDTSMTCIDDDPSIALNKETAAHRAALLAVEAEQAAKKLPAGTNSLRYVIGTEVPAPGGLLEKIGHQAVSNVEDIKETIELTRRAFVQHGLENAWERVFAIVVHPGVEFGDQIIYDYNPELTYKLKGYIETNDQLIYEAHSTDYQTEQALKRMVADHFAILKVGPALTFTMRQALYSLEFMEKELLQHKADIPLSCLRQTLEKAMLNNPLHWQNYYKGDQMEQAFARSFSYSDRIRYYWSEPSVTAAVATLIRNLQDYPPHLSLLNQYFPKQYELIRNKKLEYGPTELILNELEILLEGYYQACTE